jgi:hypothetical protein
MAIRTPGRVVNKILTGFLASLPPVNEKLTGVFEISGEVKGEFYGFHPNLPYGTPY